LDREHFWRIDLDARSKVLGYETVSIGTISASLVHPRELFKGAILNNAAAIIIAHNHPSQDTTPSAEDKEVTRRIQKAGEILGIPLLDHMVLTDDRFHSFKESGMI
jgi:DNA repair protein RadC